MKLKENEKIIKVLKNHYFTNIILWFFTFLFLLILWGIYYIFPKYKYIFLVLVILTQIFLVFFYCLLINFEIWKIIFTNFRIIWVKKINIFNSEYLEKDLVEIKEIKAKSKWIFANYFWFGKLTLEFKNWENISLNYTENVLNEWKEIMRLLKNYK